MLEKLQEYKELIGIIVFFLGGFFWIENQFPSKSDLTAQLSVLRCEVQEYMSLTELQLTQSHLQNDLTALNEQYVALSSASGDPLHSPPAVQQELGAVHDQQQIESTQLKETGERIQAITGDLETQICQKP